MQGLLSQELSQSAPYRFSDEKNGACTAYIKRGAQGLGFENVNTFIRVFKSFEGISPGVYKETLLKKESDADPR